MTGGAGDWKGHPNRCVAACIRRAMACYAVSRPLYWRVRTESRW